MYFFSMLINRLLRRTARPSSRGGFTLVELLVVIAIIAILAGVALGPITSGIKKGQQSAGVQTARTLALAEFQYSNDNNQVYPYDASKAENIASTLIGTGYIGDAQIFVINGSTAVKYVGAAPTLTAGSNPPAYTGLGSTNVSWDFGVGTTAGLTPNAPDDTPLVISDITSALVLTGAGPIQTPTLTGVMPFGTAGVAVCFKSNSCKFINAPPTAPIKATIEDAGWQGYTATTVIP